MWTDDSKNEKLTNYAAIALLQKNSLKPLVALVRFIKETELNVVFNRLEM